MKVRTLLMSIKLVGLLLLSVNAYAQSNWKSATYEYCRKIVNEYEQPGFWGGIASSFSDSAKFVIQTYNDNYITCIKLDRGLISVADANAQIVERQSKLKSELGEMTVSELKDSLISSTIGLGKFLLIVLGAISTVAGVLVGIKSLLSKNT